MAWNTELEGWDNKAEAEAALAAAKQHAPKADADIQKLVEGCWTSLDDEGEAEAYGIADGSGMYVLFPADEADDDGSDDDFVEPVPGFVWIYCR